MKNRIVVLVLVIVVSIAGLMLLNASSKASLSDQNTTSAENSSDTSSEATSPDISTLANYVDYSEMAYEDNSDKRRVLFFHAAWCPTCIAANKDLLKNAGKLPEDVVILKTDYDTETALKKKYGITYQHTYVQVDDQGNELAKWNGGGVDEIIASLK